MIGDGEKREYIEKLVLENNLNVEITGRLAYKDFLRYLSYCDIAINSFKEGTLVVHSYKFNDYVATGCYVMNNLPGETAEMISKYGIGDNFTKDDFNEKLLKTINNWGVIKKRLSDSLQSLQNDLLSTHSIYKQLRYRIETELLK